MTDELPVPTWFHGDAADLRLWQAVWQISGYFDAKMRERDVGEQEAQVLRAWISALSEVAARLG